MTASRLAIFALAERRLGEGLDVLRALGDAHGLRLPQAEGIHRSARPRAAGTAMTITHRRRFARDLDRDRATEAVSNMFHLDVLLRWQLGWKSWIRNLD